MTRKTSPLYSALVLVILVSVIAAGCSSVEYEPGPEITRMRTLGGIRREIEADVHSVPPVTALEAEGLITVSLEEFEGSWIRITDMRPQYDNTREWMFHLKGDRFFFQAFERNEHGLLYLFATRGPLLEDARQRIYFYPEEIRIFDVNLMIPGLWEEYTGQDIWQMEFLQWPFVLRDDPDHEAILFYQLSSEEVDMTIFRLYRNDDDYIELFIEEDAGLQYFH